MTLELNLLPDGSSAKKVITRPGESGQRKSKTICGNGGLQVTRLQDPPVIADETQDKPYSVVK